MQTDKKYQLADWRVRPLPEELMLYARMDTHYLLYIYDCLKVYHLGLSFARGHTYQDASSQSFFVALALQLCLLWMYHT